jgi:hypothetical protein
VADNDTKFAVLIALDIFSAVDIVGHKIVLDRLQSDFAISSLAQSWLRSYLSDRKQFVRFVWHSSSVTCFALLVPHGSILGPLLSAAYHVQRVSAKHGVKDDFAFLWEHAIFRHPPNKNPLTDRSEILHTLLRRQHH